MVSFNGRSVATPEAPLAVKWEEVLKEAQATYEIIANPGTDEIQVRWAPQVEEGGNFPGFYVIARYTRDDFKEYRKNLRIFQRQLRASNQHIGIMDLDIGTRTKVGVVYNDDDFTTMIQMMGEALRYAYDSPRQAAEYAANN